MIKENIVIENARIGFKNFVGAAGKFNAAGDRNFCVFLDPGEGERLQEDGWNIRWLTPKNDDDLLIPYLQVKVKYGKIPPKIYLVTRKSKTLVDEETIQILDWAEIKNIDIIIRPFNWEVNGKTGVKAYVKSMYVTLQEDDFTEKYQDIPDSAQSAIINKNNG